MVSGADVAAPAVDEGDKGGASDGLETDDQGRLYLTSGEHNAILRRLPDGTFETLVHDSRLLWPDTMSVAGGYVYVTANQLYRQDKYQLGKDLRHYPYSSFRVTIDAGPSGSGRHVEVTTLRALVLCCSLKPSPAPSSSELLGRQVLTALADHDVDGEVIRIVNRDVLQLRILRPG